ncbi:helix-turn-helix domain-containing protein [Hymenobacter sp. DG01]|uniref:helix-turn-helix domain-containing protein n=1 Tax=Hymenobacter sp. DG01 TaxID=2584940 RepID=UPI0011214147|nr:helix-turn-helix transcriptional regulator [Hymenobacter sp. DG01]
MIEQRIKELLLSRQLSPTQFADAIGISRPIVSHILSGRNKPSLEVVQRVIAAFPELSLPWLLNGTGPMLAAAPQAVAETPRSRTVRPKTELPYQPKETEAPKALESEAAPAPVAPVISEVTLATEATAAVEQVKPAVTASVVPSEPSTQAGLAQTVSVPGKVIRRIVIFYQDGTFSDFQPEQ